MTHRRDTRSIGLVAIGIVLAVSSTGCTGKRVAADFAAVEQQVQVGRTAYLTTADGQRLKGQVTSVSPSSLRLSMPGAATREFTPADVSGIRIKDSLWNGMLIGAATMGLFGTVLMEEGCVAPYAVPECRKTTRAEMMAISAGFGAAVGAGIDALRHRQVYRGAKGGRTSRLRVTPLVHPTSVAVQVSVTR